MENPGYRRKGIRHCVEYYSPCDTSKKGTHVKYRRCKKFAPG